MTRFSGLQTPAGMPVELAIKIVVATGMVHQFAEGDLATQTCDTIAGRPLEQLTRGEHLANRGEVLLTASLAEQQTGAVTIIEWRTDPTSAEKFAVIDHLVTRVALRHATQTITLLKWLK